MVVPVRTLAVVGVVIVIIIAAFTVLTASEDIETGLGGMRVQIIGVDENGEEFNIDTKPPLLVKVGGKVITKLLFRVEFWGETNDPLMTQYNTYKGTTSDMGTGLFICVYTSTRPDQCVQVFDRFSQGTGPKDMGTRYNLKNGAAGDTTTAFEFSAYQIEASLSPGNWIFGVTAQVVYSNAGDTTPTDKAFVTMTLVVSVEAGQVNVNLSPIDCQTDVGEC